MLKAQNDYSIPEKQQELRGFVEGLDGNAFKESNGSEVPFHIQIWGLVDRDCMYTWIQLPFLLCILSTSTMFNLPTDLNTFTR